MTTHECTHHLVVIWYTMPLTAAQTTPFFEQDAQVGIPHATVMQLQQEGITIVDDLINFNKDTIKQRLLQISNDQQEGSQILIQMLHQEQQSLCQLLYLVQNHKSNL
jgi:hypothetical protein